MKALLLHETGGPPTVSETPTPEPGPGEVLVRIEACGLCRSDLFIQSLPLKKTPLILGHEGVGVIESLGEGVTSATVGERVAVAYLWGTCGGCECCLGGRRRLCGEQINAGYDVDGAFAELALARADGLARVPAELDAVEAAPLACAGWTAYRAVEICALEAGQWLAVYGVGGLGHVAIQLARLRGWNVAAVDVSTEKLALAQSLGAELLIDSSAERPDRALRKIGGAHAAVSFVARGDVVRSAVRGLRRGGSLVLVGLASEDFALPLTEVVIKGVRIEGSFLGSDDDLRQVFELARQGKLKIEVEEMRLEEIPDAMERLARGELRARAAARIS